MEELEGQIARMAREFELEMATSREMVGQVVSRMHREHTAQVERLLAEAQDRDQVNFLFNPSAACITRRAALSLSLSVYVLGFAFFV